MVRGLPVAVANNPAAAAALLQAPPSPLVTGLRLRALNGFAALAQRPMFRAVRNLSLAGCRVSRGSTPWALGHSPHLAGLVRLSLSCSDANGAVALAIAQNPALAGLRALGLAGCRRLAQPYVPGMLLAARPALDDLNLSATQPAAAVVGAWAADPTLGRLAILRLSRNRLADAGAAALADSPHLGWLRRLDLSENGITETGAAALAGSPHLRALTVLDLRANPIPAAAADRLRARFGPAVRLTS